VLSGSSSHVDWARTPGTTVNAMGTENTVPAGERRALKKLSVELMRAASTLASACAFVEAITAELPTAGSRNIISWTTATDV